MLRTWADAIEYWGGSVAENYFLVEDTGPGGRAHQVEERKAIARDRTLAIALIRGADPRRYGTLLITELANRYAMGTDDYPTDITSAYGLLVNYKTPVNAYGGRAQRTYTAQELTTSMTFAQQGWARQ
jgi:hypothetical protein